MEGVVREFNKEGVIYRTVIECNEYFSRTSRKSKGREDMEEKEVVMERISDII